MLFSQATKYFSLFIALLQSTILLQIFVIICSSVKQRWCSKIISYHTAIISLGAMKWTIGAVWRVIYSMNNLLYIIYDLNAPLLFL